MLCCEHVTIGKIHKDSSRRIIMRATCREARRGSVSPSRRGRSPKPGPTKSERSDVPALPVPARADAERDRAIPAQTPPLPVPEPGPTHPRTHPWGDPSPLLLLHIPVFFGPSNRGVGGSSGVLRLCCDCYGCVTVCLCSLLQVEGLLSPVPGGVCPGGLLRCCSRLASLVGSTLRLRSSSRVLTMLCQSWWLFFPHNSG